MAEKKTYAGTVGNGGTQDVKALYPAKQTKKGQRITGKDLRAGKGGK